MRHTIPALLATLIITTLARAQATPKPAPKPEANPGASGMLVAIKSAKIDYMMLKKPLPDGNFEELASSEKLLVITLEIVNKGTKEITYKSFNGAGQPGDHASLTDDKKKYWPLVQFGEAVPADFIKTATLKPNDAIVDTVVFQPQTVGAPAILSLPAKNHGDEGHWKLEVKLEEK